MEFLKKLFSKKMCVAVVVPKEDANTFSEVLTNEVERFKLDKMKSSDNYIYALLLTEYRYHKLLDGCTNADIPLAVYSTTGYLHRIVK